MTGEGDRGKTLLAVYDLSVCPVNFDFFNFLVLAEIERLRLGLDGINFLVVLGGNENPFFDGMSYGEDDKHWRLANIIMPGVTLLPSRAGISLCANRDDAQNFLDQAANIFPGRYSLENPTGYYSQAEITAKAALGGDIPFLSAPGQARGFAASWLQSRAAGRKAVVITLRQSSTDPEKNSNVSAWAEFARALDQDQYFPVIVPDTEAVFRAPDPELDGLALLPEAAVNVVLRAALYEQAYLNMFSVGGGGMLCQLIDATRYQFIRVAVPGSPDCSSEIMQATQGMAEGGRIRYAKGLQNYVWRPETTNVFAEEFAKMTEVIEGRTEAGDYIALEPEPPLVTADRMERYGFHAQARDIYLGLLDREPGNGALIWRAAASENSLGRHRSAHDRLGALAPPEAAKPEVQEQRARALAGLGRNSDAIDPYRAAIAGTGAGSELHLRAVVKLAWIYSDETRVDDMIALLQSEMRADPENRLLHRVMGEALEIHGFTREAEMCFATELSLCRAAAEAEPLTAEAGSRIGILELKLGHVRPAIAILQSVLDQDPSYWQAHEHLGDAYWAARDQDRAIAHYREAIARSWGRQASFLYKLAKALQAAGELDEALEVAIRCQRLAEDHLPTYGLLAELSQDAGRMDEALRYITMAREVEATAAV